MLRSIVEVNTPKALADHVDSVLHPLDFLPFFFLNAVADELSHAPSHLLSVITYFEEIVLCRQ